MSLTFYSSLINNFNDVAGNVDGIPLNITWKSTNRGLKPELNGSNAKIAYGDIGTVKTIALWVHLRSTTESILDINGTQTIDIAAGTVRGNNWTSPTVYVDGAATASLSNLTGFHHIVITTATGIAASAVVAGLISAAYGKLIIDDIRGYDNELSAGEALALYNATSGEYGPMWAEKSYQHDPLVAIPEQTGEVLRIGGKLAGDAVDTISDRSGSGNDATIAGAMPADGYFIGGRRIINDNTLTMPSGLSTQFGADDPFTAILLWKTNNTSGLHSLLGRAGFHQELRQTGGNFVAVNYDSSDVPHSTGTTSCNVDTLYICIWKWTGSIVQMKIDSVSATDSDSFIGRSYVAAQWINGLRDTGSNQDIQNVCLLIDSVTTDIEDDLIFNTLAVLPIFELNFRDYPDNPGATWTDNTLIPFSSGVVGSNGTWSVDGDQLICGEDSSTCTFRNNFKFDGQEYITVTIDGTEYSGTGTITQGSVTVSIAQGSNKITIAADDGDMIDAIAIQFRATV